MSDFFGGLGVWEKPSGICPDCKAETPPGTKFCGSCGKKL